MTLRELALAAGLLASLASPTAAQQSGWPSGTHPTNWQARDPQGRTRPTTTLSAGAGVQWDDNARYAPRELRQRAWTPNATAGIMHSRPLGREAVFGLTGSGTYYNSNVDELTRFDYGGGLSFGWSPSRSFSLSVNQTASSMLARDNRLLLDAGLVYNTRVVRADSSLGMGGSLSQRVSWNLGLNYYFNLFEAQLVDDRQASAQANIGYAISRYSSVYLGMGMRQSFVNRELLLGNLPGDYRALGRVYNGSLGWRRQDNNGFSIDLGAGVGYLESQDQLATIGGVRLSKSAKFASFSAQYSRNFDNTYGLGAYRLVNTVNGTVSVSFWKVGLSAGMFYTWGRVLDREFRQKSLTPQASLSFPFALGDDLSLHLGYNYSQANLLQDELNRGSNRVDVGINWRHTLGQRKSRR